MSGSDDRVRTDRSLLLRAVESLGNGSTRPLETNSENTSSRLQLANHDASGGRGVQREPAYESAAISTPTSKALLQSEIVCSILVSPLIGHAHQMHHDWQAEAESSYSPSWFRVAVWIHCPNSPPHVKEGF